MSSDWIEACDPVQIRNEILPWLKKDIAKFQDGLVPSNLCVTIPKLYRRGGKVHAIIAEMLYGENVEDQMNELCQKLERKRENKGRIPVENNRNLRSVEIDDDSREKGEEDIYDIGGRINCEGSSMETSDIPAVITDDDLNTRLQARWNCRLDVLLTKMRNSITKARDEKRRFAKRHPEPVQAVEHPEALPMDSYPNAEEFKDLIEFLMCGGSVASDSICDKEPSNSIQFKHGSISSDGCIDFCEQGFTHTFAETGDAVSKDGELPLDSVHFNHGNINSDGRLDLCKQGFRNAFTETCEAVIKDGEQVPDSVHFKHGNINSDGRLDLCKQGFRNAFTETCEAVIKDGEQLPDSVHFKHGDINSDGRLDLCKQGFRNAFTETCEEMIKDGKQLPDSVHLKHGSINSDGRLDLCKQGFRNAFTETCEAVIKDGEQLSDSVHFKHGNINSDGRLDLCKQGFRNAFMETCEAVIKDGEQLPDSVQFKHRNINSDSRFDLCKQRFKNAFVETFEAVKYDSRNKNTRKPLVRHYLIGNNRIAEDGDIPGEGDRRVVALTRMIRHRPDILTWYLAGNSLDSEQIRLVAEALEQTRTKYVWFKMNPVKTGAYYLGKMLMRTPSIELLDLFNCGLCNDGVEEFARGLAEAVIGLPSTSYANLRHLYICINAISSTKPIKQILNLLPQLESFFLGVNPFGDEGFIEISGAIVKAPCRNVLQRLSLGSMGLTDASLPCVKNIIKACPSLASLELGSYKSTNYFGQKHNRFDVKNEATRLALKEIARALVFNSEMLIDKYKAQGEFRLHYLGLQHTLVVDACPSDRIMHISEAKAIIDDVTKNQLHRGTGVNVNGITNLYPTRDGKTYWHNGEREVRDKYVTGAPSCHNVADKNPTPRTLVAGGLFFQKGVTSDLQFRMKNPWPAVDYIKSIYRGVMKT